MKLLGQLLDKKSGQAVPLFDHYKVVLEFWQNQTITLPPPGDAGGPIFETRAVRQLRAADVVAA